MLQNLFYNLPQKLPQEQLQVLAQGAGVRVERIVSTGQTSPTDFWYDQDEFEWVVVLQGAARLRLAERDQPIELGVGDHLLIPPHCKHRVEWTSTEETTVWLAVFYNA